VLEHSLDSPWNMITSFQILVCMELVFQTGPIHPVTAYYSNVRFYIHSIRSIFVGSAKLRCENNLCQE
jgi:hypothetical protein